MTQCMEKSAFKYTECIFLCENLAVNMKREKFFDVQNIVF
jgi:hypothetical protein